MIRIDGGDGSARTASPAASTQSSSGGAAEFGEAMSQAGAPTPLPYFGTFSSDHGSATASYIARDLQKRPQVQVDVDRHHPHRVVLTELDPSDPTGSTKLTVGGHLVQATVTEDSNHHLSAPGQHMGTVKTDSFGRQYYEANFDEYMDRNGNFHRGVTVFVEAEQTDEENPRPLGLGAYIVEPARDPSKKDYPGRIVEINDDADPNVDPTKTDRITVNVQPHAGDGGLDTVYTTSPDLGLYADKWPWNWEGAWPWKW